LAEIATKADSMPKLFISYRRQDTPDATGRLYDRLKAHFGAESVFYDVDTIPLGVDFRKHMGDQVGKCDVFLAIIGDHWLSTCYEDGAKQGQRRLDDPEDWVRIEIEAALSREIPVIPVLVARAKMPGKADLPSSLQDLVFRNAAEVRSDGNYESYTSRLVQSIERIFADGDERKEAAEEAQRERPEDEETDRQKREEQTERKRREQEEAERQRKESERLQQEQQEEADAERIRVEQENAQRLRLELERLQQAKTQPAKDNASGQEITKSPARPKTYMRFWLCFFGFLALLFLEAQYHPFWNADSYFSRGNEFAQKKEYDKAIEYFSKAIELNPKDDKGAYEKYYSGRGQAYYDKKDYDKAIDDYSKCIEIAPKVSGFTIDLKVDGFTNTKTHIPSQAARYYNQRGKAYYDKKDYAKAIDDYSEAVKLEPDISEYESNLADAYKSIGNERAAEYHRKLALERCKREFGEIPP